ncbi:beta-propeller domain-containing protein [Sphingomicrobium clamense]|uniref:Beta-propeller domain-containing protein n=1 Tax=Sphingomicrobium clamense TaxID=2851013 RepID=A0ABS6V922_9SPHN|nr:beta-propeller domain-containing protein [Sphingomicrobium sp. B8]MBW0145657.1 beta-propeller domain-containing protein [Sphingomicrobium sp. B8]
MSRSLLVTLLPLTALGCASQADSPPPTPQAGLASFESEEEFLAFYRKHAQQLQRRENNVQYEMADGAIPAPPPPAATAPEAMVVTGSRVSDDAITNTQVAGVDEGGIVKKRGDILVVLRRGRLFTMSIADGSLAKIDQVDAYPPGTSGQGSWYDEMLLKDDMVVVIGYSYARGGTEVIRFNLDADGELTYRDATHLRSNDYYSSRNYASRLIGDRLVYYTPLYLGWGDDPYQFFPAWRRWRGQVDEEFTPLLGPTELYYVPTLRGEEGADFSALHSVIECDLTAREVDCDARAVLGPSSRTFFVSQDAVYLWMSNAYRWDADRKRSFLYRLPFSDDETPSAIATFGQPVDQFSFREDTAGGILDVLVRNEGGGDWMWNPEVTGGDVALLSLPLSELGDGSGRADARFYRDLPAVEGYNFQNRFVGRHILYGAGNFAARKPAILVAADTRGGPITPLAVPHAIERLDLMGSDGIVIGSGAKGLTFTSVLLDGTARLGSDFTFPKASQGENRSHAYFFRPDNRDGTDGILGLPVAKRLEPSARRFLGNGSAILFLERDDRALSMAGELVANAAGARDDACVASCVDWYGNARPIFVGDRVFALMGYELVEGRFDGSEIREIARLDYAPAPRPRR